jgi:hypothetical protein
MSSAKVTKSDQLKTRDFVPNLMFGRAIKFEDCQMKYAILQVCV